MYSENDEYERPSQEIILDIPKAHSRKQQLIYQAFQIPGLREIWIAAGTKYGKAAWVGEDTPTPSGWKKFGDIREGDYVFDERGEPTKVTFCTPIAYGRDCFKVTFSDGASVIVDGDHLWETSTHAERKNLKRTSELFRDQWLPKVRTTLEIKGSLLCMVGGGLRPNHSIPTTLPVKFCRRSLPINPYLLGVWLGDGSSRSGQITKDDSDSQILEEICKDGDTVKRLSSLRQWAVLGLAEKLASSGLILNKHIPADYLLSSIEDRLSLVQGLMDTDGTIDKRGNCCFDNTNKNLAEGLRELLHSLGVKTTWGERIGKLNGEEHKLCYRVGFSTDLPVFRLKRKRDRLKSVSDKSRRRYIVSVDRIDSVPVKCIKVDSPRSLFLIGRWFIPTHNTVSASVSQVTAGIVRPNTKWRWVAPIYTQACIAMDDYFPKLVPPHPYSKVNRSDLSITIPSNNTIFEFWHAQNPSSLEGAAVNGYVFDEASKMKPEARSSARTTTTRTKGPMMFISYPFGKNWFYVGCMEAKAHMEWSLKNGKEPEKIFLTAPTSDNPHIDFKVIEDARRELPERLFRQFYLAEFVDDGQVFVGFRDRFYGPELSLGQERQIWTAPEASEKTVVVGADWAKTTDYTVFFAADVETRKIVGLERFNRMPYTEAVRRLKIFCNRFKSTVIVRHDKTGVGTAIDDLLAVAEVPAEGITFTNQTKADMVAKLMTAFDTDGQIGLPRWDILASELESYDVTTSASGNFIYGAPAGKHDDAVSALMLMNTALIDYGNRDYQVRMMEDLPKTELALSPLAAFYRDLMDD